MLSLPLLSRVRLWLTNLIDWLILLVCQYRLVHLYEHQVAEMLVTPYNYKVPQDMFKNVPHVKKKCGKNAVEKFAER